MPIRKLHRSTLEVYLLPSIAFGPYETLQGLKNGVSITFLRVLGGLLTNGLTATCAHVSWPGGLLPSFLVVLRVTLNATQIRLSTRL
jgi:hypothetical protein